MLTQASWSLREADLPTAVRRTANRLQGGLSRKLAQYVVTKRVRASNDRPLVSFSFDDIPDSAFIHGSRVLEERGARGTFYIAGGLCGRTEPDRRLISASDCVELHRRGHEIGCHTFSHPVVQLLDANGFAAELDRNKQFFASLAPDLTLENFCYPYGKTSLRRKLQAQARFHSCRGSVPGINVGTIDLGMLKGTPIDQTTEVAKIVHAIDETVRRNGWLILFTHDVSPAPTWIGCTPQFLDAAVATALRHGCDVVTVREGLIRVGSDTNGTMPS
jgi:peptidoglycan/xylan/chitin deacetylase (PgdA/CDA1 family)